MAGTTRRPNLHEREWNYLVNELDTRLKGMSYTDEDFEFLFNLYMKLKKCKLYNC